MSLLENELKSRFGKVKISSNGWLSIPCPTCTDHNRKKCKRYIHPGSRSSNCFICGIKLNVENDLLKGQVKLNYDQSLSPQIPKVVDPRATQLPYHQAIPVDQLPKDHPAVKFLNKDHLHDMGKLAKDHGIVYVPYEHGKIFKSSPPFTTSAERLVFPVVFGGNMVGWQMRSIPGTFYGDRPDVLRYYHLFDKGNYLYNYDNAKKFKDVVVVEGVKKALKFPNAVATWGSSISPRQLQLIQEWEYIAIMLDGEDDNGTQDKARKHLQGMKLAGKQVINIDLRHYNATSPDDLPAEQLQEILTNEWSRTI